MIVLDGEDPGAFNEHRARFYALIGHCVVRYQSVEDYLPDVFAAALGGDTARARAIFAVVRGLEAKLDVITAALTSAPEPLRGRWNELLRRVADAAKARNQIAHGGAVNNGGMVRVTMSKDPTVPAKVDRVKPARMELHKRKPGAGVPEKVWTEQLLRDEYDRTDKLFGHLIAFAMELEGKTAPPHLLEP